MRRAGLAAVGLVLAVCLGLAGCGPDRQAASGANAENYFPLIEGSRWLYQLNSKLGEIDVEVSAIGELEAPHFGPMFVLEEKNLGEAMGFVRTAPVGYLEDDTFHMRMVGIDYDDDGGLVLLGEDEPVKVLPSSPEDGQTWSQSTRMFTTPEGGGGRLGWEGAVSVLAELTVPAGTFQDVLQVRTVYIDQSESNAEPQVVYHDYYAKGIGLIKSVTDDVDASPENHMEQVLVEYRLTE